MFTTVEDISARISLLEEERAAIVAAFDPATATEDELHMHSRTLQGFDRALERLNNALPIS